MYFQDGRQLVLLSKAGIRLIYRHGTANLTMSSINISVDNR